MKKGIHLDKLGILLFTVVFPLIMHNGYFDLSNTKLVCFFIEFIVFLIVYAVSFFARTYECNTMSFSERIVTDWPYLIVGISVLITQLFAVKKTDTFWGIGEYGVGTLFIWMIIASILIIKRTGLDRLFLFQAMSVTSIIMSGIALLQYWGMDPFFLLRNVAYSKSVFLSTVGNAAIFGVYMVITTPMTLYLFVKTNVQHQRIIGAVGFAFCSIGALVASTDATILAYLLMLLGSFWVLVRSVKEAKRICEAGIILGLLWFVFRLSLLIDESEYLVHTIVRVCIHPAMSLGITAISLFILLYMNNSRELDDKGVKNISGIISAIGGGIFILLPVSIVAYTLLHSGNPNTTLSSFLYFDNYWGSYRGYIWRKAFELYSDGSLMQKIFGYGGAIIGSEMYERTSQYAADLFNISMEIYDAHNFFIQWLLKYGIFGEVTLLISTSELLRRSAKSYSTEEKMIGVSIAGAIVCGLFLITQNISLVFLICIL